MKRIKEIMNNDDKLKYEFLSPALEIIDRPPSLLGSFTIKIVFAILILALLISLIGKIDIVASATGKVIPSGRLQAISPMEEGEIVKINVSEGAFVKKGQVLIELNGKVKESDLQEASKSLQLAMLEKDVALAELNGKDIEAVISKYSKNSFIKPEDLEYQKSLLMSKRDEYESKRQSLELSIDQQNSEFNISKSEKVRLDKEISYWAEETRIAKNLFEIGSISKLEWKNKEKELMNATKQRDANDLKSVQITQKIAELQKNLLEMEGQRRKDILAQIVELDKKINEFKGNSVKAEESYKYQKLTSPVNGTVHGLSSYTIGGILKPAETAITIVPEGTKFEGEVLILNKDIGYVKQNQEVEVKVEAFPFQKFGTIKGKLKMISPDAIQDEKLGYVYKAYVTLDKNYFILNGQSKLITPGMTMTAEIKTGKRRIIDFFLSPVVKDTDEGLKVR